MLPSFLGGLSPREDSGSIRIPLTGQGWFRSRPELPIPFADLIGFVKSSKASVSHNNGFLRCAKTSKLRLRERKPKICLGLRPRRKTSCCARRQIPPCRKYRRQGFCLPWHEELLHRLPRLDWRMGQGNFRRKWLDFPSSSGGFNCLNQNQIGRNIEVGRQGQRHIK